MERISPDMMSDLLKVYFITGSANCLDRPESVLKQAIEGGVTLFQYREKGEGCLVGEAKRNLGKKLQFICKEHGVPFIVNDDIELAMELDADGVHIGQEDEDVFTVREKIGAKILGVSVHNRDEADRAKRAGADYFGVGPIYPTETKKDARAVQGTSLVKELSSNGIPIVGIGGINRENAAEVIQAGADGVSVITAISKERNVRQAAAAIRDSVFLMRKEG
ncbi:thiamine phosphate synthase [Bacillus sp. REN3]|uniref:thiamine phosphate synthase n=1 Tax=Bacillus sp. REN3 TaxID=2802440 RepID=UPI001AEF0B7B|nr:thiamine phosphate synthase [Bacillus sp. REN3]